jgi:hypothetical protein
VGSAHLSAISPQLVTPRHLQNTFSVNATTFDELTPLLNKYSGAYTVAGLIGFMSALKIFKYVWCGAMYVVMRSCVCGAVLLCMWCSRV